MKRIIRLVLALAAVFATASCVKGYGDSRELGADIHGKTDGGEPDGEVLGGEKPGEGGQHVGSLAGQVTAGEWNDLVHWPFWSNLMLSTAGQDQEGAAVNFAGMSDYWGFYTNNRVAVCVKDGAGTPAAGAKVTLSRNGSSVWEAVTDNAGRADLWISLNQKEEMSSDEGLKLSVGGVEMPGTPVVSHWNTEEPAVMNECVLSAAPAVKMQADIAFIVDATGSMADEIDFLKDDLLDVLQRTAGQQGNVAFRTSALFYRDKGDEYLTRVYDFSADPQQTVNDIKRQSASGGGDYPEAVHTALEASLGKLSWEEDSRTKLAFMLLDAPAHQDQDGVVESLHKSIQAYAQRGIRLIPVASSGVDKNTEFMLRFFAIATGGTYVFLTNDSGVGGEHIIASVGEYEVEYLGDLIVRLIGEYTK